MKRAALSNNVSFTIFATEREVESRVAIVILLTESFCAKESVLDSEEAPFLSEQEDSNAILRRSNKKKFFITFIFLWRDWLLAIIFTFLKPQNK